jgi:hypothetical protein
MKMNILTTFDVFGNIIKYGINYNIVITIYFQEYSILVILVIFDHFGHFHVFT